MNQFGARCVELRKQDYTLNEIARITGRSKTSIHYYTRHIALSIRKRRLIRELYRQRALLLSEKKRTHNEKSVRRFSVWDTETVLLVAHLIFDGEIRRGKCRYSSRNVILIKRIDQLMRKVIGKSPKRHLNTNTGVITVACYNAALGRYLRDKSIDLLVEIVSMRTEYKRAFLRAFFDDEGCMDFRPKRNTRRIRGYQKNTEILEIVRKLLLDFDIGSRVQLPNEIVIAGKESMILFQKQIGFSPGVRINGNRSNSIWKESLEKRDLLSRAIKSYKPVGSNGVHRTKSDISYDHSHGIDMSMTGSKLE